MYKVTVYRTTLQGESKYLLSHIHDTIQEAGEAIIAEIRYHQARDMKVGQDFNVELTEA